MSTPEQTTPAEAAAEPAAAQAAQQSAAAGQTPAQAQTAAQAAAEPAIAQAAPTLSDAEVERLAKATAKANIEALQEAGAFDDHQTSDPAASPSDPVGSGASSPPEGGGAPPPPPPGENAPGEGEEVPPTKRTFAERFSGGRW